MTGSMAEVQPESPTRLERTLEGMRSDLRALYEKLDQTITRLGPRCALSGRCCRFQEFGHTLFLSAPELDFLLSGEPAPSRPLDDGETCPWQDSHSRCTARAARPMGCRIYFCDSDYEPKAFEVSEHFLAHLKRLTERHGLPWDYAPLHRHLHRAREEGQLSIPLASLPHDQLRTS